MKNIPIMNAHALERWDEDREISKRMIIEWLAEASDTKNERHAERGLVSG